mgnify:CR=1 FL=1
MLRIPNTQGWDWMLQFYYNDGDLAVETIHKGTVSFTTALQRGKTPGDISRIVVSPISDEAKRQFKKMPGTYVRRDGLWVTI